MLQDYIEKSWTALRRNALGVALDPKIGAGAQSFIYISKDEDYHYIVGLIAQRRMSGEKFGNPEVRVLPADLNVTQDHGILYLPNDYIVPGGRFNEMYAWDSYWIILGLLKNRRTELARGMVENFVYQIRHYGGKILNANRTYYLNRSQPPLLAPMAAAVAPYLEVSEREEFLRNVIIAATLEYKTFWKTGRYDATRGLFHYGNQAQGDLGLCPEVVYGERDEHGLSHYDKIVLYLKNLPPDDERRKLLLDEVNVGLSRHAIAGDRAMRESGFDASMHMGPYGLETVDYSPVCLNSLLCAQCRVLHSMCLQIAQNDLVDYFHREAEALHTNIQKRLWNKDTKLFASFNNRRNEFSSFSFLTSAYPLWAGIATQKQAESFRDNLSLFETPFGIKNATQQTGCQWDAPFMWAPLVYFTVEGLRRYDFTDEAQRIADKFTATVGRVYARTGANYEKYNAETGEHETAGIIEVGYSENVVGFGWTNGLVSIYT